MNISTFQIGKTYEIRFIGDSELKVPLKVERVSASSIWAKVDGEVKRMKIQTYNDTQYVNPYGTYSMNPSCRACNEYSN